MKKLRFTVHSDDLARAQPIVDMLAAQGYEISLLDAYLAWEAHSESWAASWLIYGKPEEVLKYVLRYTKEVTCTTPSQ